MMCEFMLSIINAAYVKVFGEVHGLKSAFP